MNFFLVFSHILNFFFFHFTIFFFYGFQILFINVNYINFISNFSFNTIFQKHNSFLSNFYISENIGSSHTENYNSLIESSGNVRALKNHNLLINYDYKTGHYLGSWDQLFPFLFSSFIEVSRGIRKAP